MKILRLLKMFLFVLAGLFAVITIIGLFIPSSIKIAKGIVIKADSAEVYHELSDVKDWNKWLPWITSDSGALVQLSPLTNQPGSFFKWKGLTYKSSGTITLQQMKPGTVTTLYQLKDMHDAEGGFHIRSAGTSRQETEVQWFMEYKLKWYPWERFYGIFMDRLIGPAFDKGLEQLKTYIEEKTVTAS